MKILAGYEQPSEGRVLVDGEAVAFSGSRDAEARGIVLIQSTWRRSLDRGQHFPRA
ncbi:hypothetical protein [Bosea thiooxidans]